MFISAVDGMQDDEDAPARPVLAVLQHSSQTILCAKRMYPSHSLQMLVGIFQLAGRDSFCNAKHGMHASDLSATLFY